MDNATTNKRKRDGNKDIQVVSHRNPLLLITLLFNTIIMGGVAFLQYQSYQKEKNKTDVYDVVRSMLGEKSSHQNSEFPSGDFQKPNHDDGGILMHLDGFTVNLAQDKGPRRFIRLNAVLKFSLNSKENEFRAKRPQIRDSIISILNSKKPNDLLKEEGKEYLKEQIKSSINSFLVDGKVIDIYYVGFQIN